MPNIDRAIPTLPSSLPADSLAFDAKLGFAGRLAAPDAGYAIVERGSFQLHSLARRQIAPATPHAG